MNMRDTRADQVAISRRSSMQTIFFVKTPFHQHCAHSDAA